MFNELIIHKVGEESISLIQELTMQVWPQTYAALLSEEQIGYMLNKMYSHEALKGQMQSGQQFMIAQYNQQPVGFASYGPTELADEYKLHKLYVITTNQKTGAGKGLLWYVMDEIKKISGHHLILQVNRHNENAVGFYQKMGFQFEMEADFEIGNGFYMNDYVMGINL